MIWLIPFLGALSNSFFRGGTLKQFINIKLPGRWINAILYGVCACAVSGQVVLGILLACGMYLGSMAAVRPYIVSMLGLDSIHDRWWGLRHMTIRGLTWGLFMGFLAMIAYQFFSVHNVLWYWGATILAGALQGVIVMGCIRWIHGNGRIWNYWSMSEIIHGFILWSPLIFLK